MLSHFNIRSREAEAEAEALADTTKLSNRKTTTKILYLFIVQLNRKRILNACL